MSAPISLLLLAATTANLLDADQGSRFKDSATDMTIVYSLDYLRAELAARFGVDSPELPRKLEAVERAYWDLYAARQATASREEGYKLVFVVWQTLKAKEPANRPDAAQAEEQYQFFRAARLQAMLRELELSNQLRRLIGIADDDNRQILVADVPVTDKPMIDAQLVKQRRLERRPDIAAGRSVLQAVDALRDQSRALANYNQLLGHWASLAE